ncbi:GNAT family N-acetyltransferase [Arcanobacterium phocae]|uniref:GNAT family N-acetyltransferase n=1 Tax=Arcanobacterium phocae TaxID=131112 RepID=UPI001C0ED9F0|nr:GNAT family N-acetyltransferase [Arcanobacterium phocae]
MEQKQAIFSDSDTFSGDEIQQLYDSVGWSSYTQQLELLMAGLRQSTRVVTARQNGKLIGLCRLMSDGATIVYIQDILVSPEFQRTSVGSRLLMLALEPYSGVRQKVLLTDNEERQRAFYMKHGFTEIQDYSSSELRAFVQIHGV